MTKQKNRRKKKARLNGWMSTRKKTTKMSHDLLNLLFICILIYINNKVYNQLLFLLRPGLSVSRISERPLTLQ